MDGVSKDAVEAVAFGVTKADWRKAVRGRPDECVWAQAIKRALKASWVWVGRTIVYVKYADGRLIRYAHSVGSRMLVRGFDRAEDVLVDATFWLLVPPPKRKRSKPTGGNGGGDGNGGAPVREASDIKERYARRMADPKASLDRNSSLIICEDGTRIYV